MPAYPGESADSLARVRVPSRLSLLPLTGRCVTVTNFNSRLRVGIPRAEPSLSGGARMFLRSDFPWALDSKLAKNLQPPEKFELNLAQGHRILSDYSLFKFSVVAWRAGP